MAEKLSKIDILTRIDSGEISAEEGIDLLAGLDEEPNTHKKDQKSSPGTAMDILEKIEKGELSPEDGIQHFEADVTPEVKMEPIRVHKPVLLEGTEETSRENLENDPVIKRWKSFWQIPTWIGLGLMIISSLWLYNSYENGQTFWFILSWLPFLIALLITYIGWSSRTSTWVHIRVKTDEANTKTNISISVPIPLQLGRWALSSFGHHIPQLEAESIDMIIQALDKKNLKDPLYLNVDDDENTKVQIIIG